MVRARPDTISPSKKFTPRSSGCFWWRAGAARRAVFHYRRCQNHHICCCSSDSVIFPTWRGHVHRKRRSTLDSCGSQERTIGHGNLRLFSRTKYCLSVAPSMCFGGAKLQPEMSREKNFLFVEKIQSTSCAPSFDSWQDNQPTRHPIDVTANGILNPTSTHPCSTERCTFCPT